MQKNSNRDRGFYAAGLYINCMVIDAALTKAGGKSDDKAEFMKTLRSVSISDTPRGPVKFGHLGNAGANVYIRNCEKDGGKLVNKTLQTYTMASHDRTYHEQRFPPQPVHLR